MIDRETIETELPLKMRKAKRWVLWKLVPNEPDKPKKVPYYANGTVRKGKLDSQEDVDNLATFEDAIRAVESNPQRWEGIGFALGKDGNGHWQGVDLDHLDTHQELNQFIEIGPGYIERSPSGNGVHFIGYGKPFVSLASNITGIEAYSSGRFFTVTGDAIGGSIADISDFVSILEPLHRTKEQPKNTKEPGDNRLSGQGRNTALASLAGTMRNRGMFEESILAGLLAENERRFSPPLPEQEVRQIAASYGRYQPGEYPSTDDSSQEPPSDESNPWFWVGEEIFQHAPSVDWVVNGWMTASTVSLLYGQKDTYKSFIALSIGMSVASGIDWHGNKTTKGGFAYLCGEGRAGIADRMDAWACFNHVDPKTLPLFLGKKRMRLENEEEVKEIADSLAASLDNLQWPALRLVVIDTLSSSSPGMDENDAGMMSKAIDLVKVLIAERFHCAVLLVHHSGKDQDKGARGSSSIEGNAEAVFWICRQRDNEHRIGIECKHVKDADRPETMLLERQTQVLTSGRSNIAFAHIEPDGERKKTPRADWWSTRKKEKELVRDMFSSGRTAHEIRQCLEDSGMPAHLATIYRWRDRLVSHGDLEPWEIDAPNPSVADSGEN